MRASQKLTYDTIKAQDADLRAAHAAATRDRADLAGASLPVDQVVANLRGLVDAAAEKWANENRYSIIRSASGEMVANRDGYSTRNPTLFMVPSGNLSFRDLCGLAPGLVKERLEQIARAGAFERTGPPFTERPALISDVEARLRSIEDEHTELVHVAASFTPPIMLELFPEARARQVAAQRAEEVNREQVERRRRLEDQVNHEAIRRRV